MKLTKNITLIEYMIDYVDLREPKPREHHRDTIHMDGGRISALRRLGQTVHNYVLQMYAAQGLNVCKVTKGETIEAAADLDELWSTTSVKILAARTTQALKALKAAGPQRGED